MQDPHVRPVGSPVTDIDGLVVKVGVDYDSVSIRIGGVEARLASAAACEFAEHYASALWQAGEESRTL
jgi:hypothetical protein